MGPTLWHQRQAPRGPDRARPATIRSGSLLAHRRVQASRQDEKYRTTSLMTTAITGTQSVIACRIDRRRSHRVQRPPTDSSSVIWFLSLPSPKWP
ncbi:hypothetical protein GCM10018783_53000 [Streptomyces griseosporeus]|nr:hypothetical protein GCM10018783_53000 [Streptomyces griseosporeus]